jgi:N-carbamoyl-L-amino-acid hydrolase
MRVEPNTPNTVPGRVVFTVDFRDPDPQLFENIRRELSRKRTLPGVECNLRELFCHAPLIFPAAMTSVVAEAARASSYPAMQMVSGAFHDALFVARRCPVGMVFARCRGGVRHNAEEFSDPADLAAAAQVLLNAVEVLANTASTSD